MGFLVTNKIISYMLKTNKEIMFQIFCNNIYNNRFLILYNNINFYKKYKISIYISKLIK